MKKSLLVSFCLLLLAGVVWAQCDAPTQVSLTGATGTTADFMWHKANASDAQWEVACVLSGDTLNPDTTYAAAYDTTFSFSDLTPNTGYDFYVRTFCSAESQSAWTVISFRTACQALGINDMPYADNFEAYPGTSSFAPTEMTMPYCWSMYYGGSNPNRTYYPYLFDSYGDKFIRFNVQYTDDTRGDEVALLPEIDTNFLSIGALALKFQARRIVETPFDVQDEFRLVVGAMIGNNYATFVPIDTFVITDNNYAEYETVFNNYQGNGNRIALLATSARPNTTVIFNSGSIDSVYLFMPACSRPSEIHANNIGTNSFDVAWTSTGTESEWDLQYKSTADTAWTLINNVTSNPYTITGLTAETNYEFAVRANCAGPVSEWRSATAVVSTLACDTDSQCKYTFTLSNNYTGWQGASILVYDNQVLIGTLTTVDTGSYHYQLGLCSGHALSLVWHSGAWDSDCYFSLTDPNGYLIFGFAEGQAPANNSLFFADTADCATIACPRPTQLAVSQIQSSSALVSWQAGGSETEWVVVYRVDGDTAWIEMPVSQNSYTLTGLNSAQTYDVSVKAVCGGAEESDYADLVTFTTICGVVSLPYTEDFNSYTNGIAVEEYGLPANYPDCAMPACWSFINRSSNTNQTPRAFLTSVASYVVSGKSLFLTSSNTTYLYAVMPQFADSLQNVLLSFKYRNEGTSAANGVLSIGYMTDPNDASTFNVINEYAKVNSFTEIIQSFSDVPAANSNCRLAFRYGGGTGNMYFLAIDDINVESTSACHKPTAVVATTSATDNTVQLSWVETGNATSWQVEYGPTGFIQGAGMTVTINENPCTFGDFTAGGVYDFYVRSVCAPGDVSEWSPVVSACPKSFNMPTSGTETVSMCSGAIFDNGGFDNNYADNCNASVLLYPAVEDAQVRVEGEFYIEPGSDYLVIYDGNATEDTTAVELFRTSISSQGAMLGLIPTCESTNGVLTIYFHSDYTTNYSGFRLDVSCTGYEPDTCLAPTGLSVESVTDSTAILVWDNQEDVAVWLVKYKTQADSIWTSEITSTVNTIELTGLDAGTAYIASVQAVCNEEMESEAIAVEFSTTGVGINEVTLANNISLMPNPAETYVEVRVASAVAVSEATLFNAFGQEIKHIRLTDNHARIDVSALASGMYFIRFAADNTTVTKKFIKK